MNKLIYVCSPYRGYPETNTKKARSYCRKIAIEEGNIPIAPHLFFPQFLDDNIPRERERAIKMNLDILRHAVEIRAFGSKISDGMAIEIIEAKKLGISVVWEENK